MCNHYNFFKFAVFSSILLSSACYASGNEENITLEENKSSISTPKKEEKKQAPSRRGFTNGGWKKVPAEDKKKLIPGPNDSNEGSPVTNLLHGRQFKNLGKTEKLFRTLIESLPQGTVVVWGDGFGRVSIDAFRRNSNVRVVYNELDRKNMAPFQRFQQLCVKSEDQDQLVALEGNCLKAPSDPTFQQLFSNNDVSGQVSATFGANFLHFMTPEEVVEYFAFQFDLLTPGGKTFSIFANTHLPKDTFTFAKKVTKEDLEVYLTQGRYMHELHFSKSTMVYEARRLLQQKREVLFTGFMSGEWMKDNKGTEQCHRAMLLSLFAKHPAVNFLDPHAIEFIAKTIGFEVEAKSGLYLGLEGAEDYPIDSTKGPYTGFVLKKPENAPPTSDSGYFRSSAEFQQLQQRAKKEMELLHKFYQKVTFEPQFPFFTLKAKDIGN